MPNPTAIRVASLSKAFKLPYEKHATLKSVLVNPFQKRRGYHHQRVLSDVSFSVEQGEFFGIVGRNGSGKSTLLKLLASIYPPDSGKIEIAGKLVPFIELGVGFNPELSGRDNVYLNGAMLGFSDREIDEIYDDIVAFAELEKFMDQKLKNYSSGMQVRLAFSVATRSKADILLVDEVLAVGDAAFQRKCYDYFSSLKKEKKTVIFISHDMNAVREYCGRAILIDSGRIVATGNSEEITEAYLRLFTEKSAKTPSVGLTPTRWGDASVSLNVNLKSVTKNHLSLEIETTANKNIRDQVIGVSVKAANGEIVFGTNTMLVRKDVPELKKGEKAKLTWEMPNIFRDGDYSVSVAAHGYGGLPVYDWQENAITFRSSYNKQSPYNIAPNVDLKISRSLPSAH